MSCSRIFYDILFTLTLISIRLFSINELYDILQLRSEVFVVEQDCVYQDIDEKDKIDLILNKYQIEYNCVVEFREKYHGFQKVSVDLESKNDLLKSTKTIYEVSQIEL